MVLDFGLPEQPLLRKAPLALVVCQLRFPHILGFGDELLRPVQVALSDRYPDVEIEDLQGVQFSAAGVTMTGEQQRIYRFRTHAKDWVVSVGQSSLTLETPAYAGFRDFIGRWSEIAEAAVEALGIKHQERIGLRYVNELRAPAGAGHDDLLGLVRPELLGVIGAHARTQRVLKVWQEARFAQDDGACTLQHGYAQKPDGSWAYVLDFDYYDDAGRTIDLESQMRALAQFNHRTWELFTWAVDPELFKTFEPEERPSDES
jgi:uncharacterized protein (TIGR04255 family)